MKQAKGVDGAGAGHGWPWIPTITVMATVAGVAWVRWQPEWERNVKAWLGVLIPAVGCLVLLGWFGGTSRLGWRVRVAGLGCLAIAGTALGLLLRVRGTVDGTGLPRLAWRWSVPVEGGGMSSVAPAVGGGVGLMVPQGAADSAQFLGQDRSGRVACEGLGVEWGGSAPRELWRRPVGLGWSSFAVVGGRAWTQEQVGDEERVTCLALATGTNLWVHAERTRFSEWQGGDGPRATPTVSGGRVYSMGATGLLTCLEVEDGRRVWRRDVLAEHGLSNLTWGTSCSPLMVDGLVVVTGGKGTNGTLFAFRAVDGSLAWKAGDEDASYASPGIATLAGRRVVLSSNAKSLTAHEPGTGRVLMRHPWGSAQWPKASQPVVLPGDRVFLSGGYGMGCQMVQVLDGPDGTLRGETVWRGMAMKTQFNSAAMHEGHLYGLDDGFLACVDAVTGRRVWKDGRYGSGQTLLAGGFVVVQGESGGVHLCRASPEGFRELWRKEVLGTKTWNQPVLAGRYLLVRNDREAVCLGW